jgi:hypothetical protein
MELIGDEKRIRALFSEVRLADEQMMPSFVGVWNRAQSKSTRPHRVFNLSFVAATALLVCALVSLAWWTSRRPRSPERIATVPPITKGGPQNVGQSPVNAVVGFTPVPRPHNSERSRALKLAARRQAVLIAANKKAARDAKAIESWQSPTAKLLNSSSDGLLKSLPQLNQTVEELKSFLPSQPK